jgi:Kef-type K+ transport system membrane component KefB
MPETAFSEPVPFFLIIMAVILVTPILSEWLKLPGIVGLILGGMLIGPHVLGLLPAGEQEELLASIGLIYLMFSAGLEVNLAQFARLRWRSLTFGAITYLIPQVLGSLFGLWIGLDLLGAILLGSAFSSHTLIAFPIITRMGIARNEAVAVTVGATVFTDIAAFIVLAMVVGSGDGGSEGAYLPLLLPLLIIYAVLLLVGLPYLGRLFFRRFTSHTVEFQFVLVALLAAAFLAELIGVHAVVGAFLAGLAVNATISQHSPVSHRVLFMGEAFFIPIFLVYSGMITDPLAFIRGGQTVLLALGITVIAYVSKLIAAWLAARIFRYSIQELMTMWGLSHAQAAVTIPTLILGLAAGLFNQELFNAAILMILLTSITSPIIVQRFGRHLREPKPSEAKPKLFKRMLVPLSATPQENLLTLADLLANSQSGTLLACHPIRELYGKPIYPEGEKDLLESPLLDEPSRPVIRIKRIDRSVGRAILHAAEENDATSVLIGWRGETRLHETIFGTVVDEVVAGAGVPVLVAKLVQPLNGMRDIAMIIPPDTVSRLAARNGLRTVVEIGQALDIPIKIIADADFEPTLRAKLRDLQIDHPYTFSPLDGDVIQAALRHSDADTFILIPTTTSSRRFRSSLGRIPHHLSAACTGSLLVVCTPPTE